MNVQKLKEQENTEDEFFRIATILSTQGDVNVLCDLISIETKEDFITSWNEGA